MLTILAAAVALRYRVLGIAGVLLSCLVGAVASARGVGPAPHAILLALGMLCALATGILAQTPR